MISDGTVKWYYHGATTAADPLAPAISDSSTAPDDTLTNFYGYLANAGAFSFAGGWVDTSCSATAIGLPVVTAGHQGILLDNDGCGTSNNLAGIAASVTFYTDAPKFYIKAYGDVPYQIIVDGSYLFYGGRYGQNGGGFGNGYITIDYRSAGGRAVRRVTLESGSNVHFSGVGVGPLDSVWAPEVADHVRVIVVGDSITGGSPASLSSIRGHEWYMQTAKMLGLSDVWGSGLGGTGYIAKNPAGGNLNHNFIERLSDVTAHSPDLIVIFGGTNDIVYTPAEVQAAAASYYQAIRRLLPSVPILVFGVWSSSSGPNPSVMATEAAIQAAVAATNDPLLWFIPFSLDPQGAWISGTGSTMNPNGSGNSDIYVGGPGDITHPSYAGSTYLAQRVTHALLQVWQQMP